MGILSKSSVSWPGFEPKNGGPKGCWIGYQTGEEKGEDPDETGERTYT